MQNDPTQPLRPDAPKLREVNPNKPPKDRALAREMRRANQLAARGRLPGEKRNGPADERRPDQKVVRLLSKVPAPIEPRSGLSEFTRQVIRVGAVFIGVPTLCSILYFGLWASNQYVTEMRFAIRTADSSTASSSLGSGGLSGLVSGFTGGGSNLIADSYILLDYLANREIVEKLDKDIGLRKLYSSSNADFFARFTGWFRSGDSMPVEHFVNYWQNRITVAYDMTTSIVTVQVKGFTPIDSLKVATAVRDEAESLVNRLSDKAIEDALKASKAEVQRAESRVQLIRGLMRRFRDKEQLADPVAAAGSKQTNVAALEQQLAQVNTAVNFRKSFMDENSPTMTTLRARAEALEKEIARARTTLGSDEKAAFSGTLATYDDLETQRQFAQQALISSLAMLEQARNSTDRMRRYLAIYEEPKLPQYAAYPKVFANILITFLGSTIIFLLLLLVYQGVRDHAPR